MILAWASLFKQNLQEHIHTQSIQPSNWKLYFATQRREEAPVPLFMTFFFFFKIQLTLL